MLYDSEPKKKTCIRFQKVTGFDGLVKRCAEYGKKTRRTKKKQKPTRKR